MTQQILLALLSALAGGVLATLVLRRWGGPPDGRDPAREVEARERLHRLETEAETLRRRLDQATLRDPLTGLWNRRFLFETMARDVAMARRRHLASERGDASATPIDFTFLMLDIDRLREVNETWGISAGDRLLQQVTSILQRVTREADVLIRWGGDEFLIVARDIGADKAGELAERIRTMIGRNAFHLGDRLEGYVTCSIGFASYPFVSGRPDLLGWEDVLSVADRALAIAKRRGGDAWAGLVSTARTPSSSLLDAIRYDGERLIEAGMLGCPVSPETPGRLEPRSQEPPAER